MPVYIGDYLADTMHLSTEQHGAYLLLLFHLWRRGTLQDDDGALAQITGLSPDAWSSHRAVLGEFFELRDGLWQHGRVERERTRIAAKQLSNSSKARAAASSRWSKQLFAPDADGPTMDASGIASAVPGDAKSESESKSYLVPTLLTPRSVDARHSLFRGLLSEYWRAKNHAAPEMPWQGRDAKALSDFLAASPRLNEGQFSQMLDNRARSAVAHGDRVYLWIANLTRYQEEMTVYNKPVSQGGANASRAEINRNSVVSAVERALALARESGGRAGAAGAEPAAFYHAGVPAADGSGPGGCSAGLPGGSDYRLAAWDAADGAAGADGSVSYCAASKGAGGVVAVRGLGK